MESDTSGVSSTPAPPPMFDTIQTSLVYDMIRGNIRGHVEQLDSALTIDDEVHKEGNWGAPSVYINEIIGIARGQVHRQRERHDGWDKMCKVDGCKSHVHSLYWAQGTCYSHGPTEDKICVKCKKRTFLRAGRLCRICFKGDSDDNEEKVLLLCRACGSRRPRKAGGRCILCVIDVCLKARMVL